VLSKTAPKIFEKMFRRGSKKIVKTTADIVSRSPEAASPPLLQSVGKVSANFSIRLFHNFCIFFL
jgi:hypothetical protein